MFLCIVLPPGSSSLCYNYLPSLLAVSVYCSAPGLSLLLSLPSLLPISVYCSAPGGFLLCYLCRVCSLFPCIVLPQRFSSLLSLPSLLPISVYCSAPGGFFSVISAESAPYLCVLFCPRVLHLSVIIICRVCSLSLCIVLPPGSSSLCYNYLPSLLPISVYCSALGFFISLL